VAIQLPQALQATAATRAKLNDKKQRVSKAHT